MCVYEHQKNIQETSNSFNLKWGVVEQMRTQVEARYSVNIIVFFFFNIVLIFQPYVES